MSQQLRAAAVVIPRPISWSTTTSLPAATTASASSSITTSPATNPATAGSATTPQLDGLELVAVGIDRRVHHFGLH